MSGKSSPRQESGQASLNFEQNYDQDRMYKLLSAFQNRIRDGKVAQAMYLGYQIWEMHAGIFWNRVQVVAVEDAPAAIIAMGILRDWYDDLPLEKRLGEGRMAVLRAGQLLAQAQKDRMADELLHTIIAARKGYAPAQQDIARLGTFEDKDIVPHLGRGYRYFVEVKSQTENQSADYQDWRPEWVALMRNADLSKKDLESS